MARPAKFTVDQILDAARDAVQTHWREATIAQVSALVGAPTGSIYHRFPSRDALFGALWARSIRRFHEGLVAASEIDDPSAALAALTVHIPRFCREHPGDAKAMTLYRLPDLLERVPHDGRADLATINDEVNAGLRTVVARRYGSASDDLVRLALVATRQCPYGMIRPLIGEEIPVEFDAMCVAAAEGILALGD